MNFEAGNVAVTAAVVVVSAIATLLVLRLLSRRAAQREVWGTVKVAGVEHALPALVWCLSRFGDHAAVAQALTGPGSQTFEGTEQALENVVAAMTPAQLAAFAGRYEQFEKAQAELQVWRAQTDGLVSAGSAGSLDAFILALGENPEWTSSLVVDAMEHVDVSTVAVDVLIGKVTKHAVERLLPEDTYAAFVEHLDNVVGTGVDASFDLVGNVALEGLSAVADAHIPVVTIGRALFKANQAVGAGLDGVRVSENVAWDVGAKGGGVAAGALIGTAVMPVVGTVIGGFLGGLLGGSVAESGKSRHLRAAQDQADQALFELGQSVGEDEWMTIASRLEESVREDAQTLERLDSWQVQARNWRGLTRRRGTEALRAAFELGTFTCQRAEDDLAAWRQELVDTAGPDGAYHRGACLAVRRDLRDRLGADEDYAERAVSSQQVVSDERDKLKLA